MFSLLLCFIVLDLPLGVLKMLILKCFRDVLQPAV